jgi:kumamolisin
MGVQVVNQAFVAAQSRGITICCAAGDDGSSDQVARGAHVDFPASSPNVLGVGGTKIVATTGSKPTIKTETVWNEVLQQDGATGGGVSAVFSKPAYQVGVAIPPSANSPHQIGRGVPDVAALGDPMTGLNVIHVDGTRLDIIGGTSASAPFWASLVARLNTALKTRCGFLNPVLYTKCAKGVLRDITVGNNGAYEAGPGWDACSGLGSPDGVKLVSALGGAAKSARKSAGNRRPAKKGGSTAAKSRR